LSSARVSSAVHGFPTGLSSPRRDSNADPLAQEEVRLPVAPRG